MELRNVTDDLNIIAQKFDGSTAPAAERCA